jgi:hypothetical protein
MGTTERNQAGPSSFVGLRRRSVFRVSAFLHNLFFLIGIDSVTFFFYYADSAVIFSTTPIDTKVVEEAGAMKKSSARIADTKIGVQIFQWTLIF